MSNEGNKAINEMLWSEARKSSAFKPERALDDWRYEFRMWFAKKLQREFPEINSPAKEWLV